MEISVSDLVYSDEVLHADYWDSKMPTQDEVASVCSLILSAPREIQDLLQLMITDAVSLHSYRRKGKKLRIRETNNEHYCRLLGLPTDYDLAGKLERHFLG
jgi:hypothetical protein